MVKKFSQRRSNYILVGIDEVGRGSLVGSVTAAAVTVRQMSGLKAQMSNLKLKDSKRLSSKKREEIYKILKNQPEVEWGIGRVSEKVIDKINILQATKLAMVRATRNLENKIGKKINFLIIDGNFCIDLAIPQKSIIKGDEKVFLIKLSSIIAKITRDKMMLRYHKKYPKYRFDKHKGYGTKLHLKSLEKYGPTKIHRKSFRPVKELL